MPTGFSSNASPQIAQDGSLLPNMIFDMSGATVNPSYNNMAIFTIKMNLIDISPVTAGLFFGITNTLNYLGTSTSAVITKTVVEPSMQVTLTPNVASAVSGDKMTINIMVQHTLSSNRIRYI